MSAPPRRPLVAGNWKMNNDAAEALALCGELRARIGNQPAIDVAVCPPFLALPACVDALAGSSIWVAGQTMHEADSGPHTGEVSAPMLVAAGARGVILGHSERRAAGEHDAQIAARTQRAIERDLIPIVCVGESLDVREAGTTREWLSEQLMTLLPAVRPDQASRLVIAYEPIWAIGTGRTATPEIAQEACAHIRSVVGETHPSHLVRILYGGSVTADNAALLLQENDIDGALVGGASLDPASFARIVEAAE